MNEGSFRALDVVLPEGNLMMARFPRPHGRLVAADPTVVDTILTALAPAWPDHVPAGASRHAWRRGRVLRHRSQDAGGASFIQSIEGGGWGGRPTEDGKSGTVSVCQGDVRNGAIEAIELKCPVLIEERAPAPDSGGAGKFRGARPNDSRVLNSSEGRWNLRAARPRIDMPALGHPRQQAGRWIGNYLLRTPEDNEFKVVVVDRPPHPRSRRSS